MRKSLGDLAVMVSADSGISEEEAKAQVAAVLNTMIRVLREGDSLMVSHFGRFETQYRRPRRYRNIESGEPHLAPGRKVVRFRPARKLMESIQ